MNTRGLFITFEGPEGSGKTTQARMLVEKLKARGLTVHYTREPGGTPLGEAIRGLLQHNDAGEAPCNESEVLLFAASRAQLVRNVILPALERGDWVVSDRFADSTTAYQGFGRGFGVERMIQINAFAIGAAIPDRTFLLDVDIAVGFERLAQRHAGGGAAADRIENEARAFHEQVREGYLELARRDPERFLRIDSTRPEHEVAALILEDIDRVIAAR